jgi:hypothetical protein
MKDTLPPLKPIAPIVDQMRELAKEHLSDGCTCRIKLYEDGTYKIRFVHSNGEKSCEFIHLTPPSEIVHVTIEGAHEKEVEFSDGGSIIRPGYDTYDAEVLCQVEPPDVPSPVGWE